MTNRCESVGIMRITPSMTAIIAADIAAKAGGAEIAVMDRFSGSVIIMGDVAAVEAGLQGVADVLGGRLGFDVEKLTRS
jgi:ethanolamine utilization protein EutS